MKKAIVLAALLLTTVASAATIIPLTLPSLRIPVVSLIGSLRPLVTLLLGNPCSTYVPPPQGDVAVIEYYCGIPNDNEDPDIQIGVCTEGCDNLTIEYNAFGQVLGVKLNGLPL